METAELAIRTYRPGQILHFVNVGGDGEKSSDLQKASALLCFWKHLQKLSQYHKVSRSQSYSLNEE